MKVFLDTNVIIDVLQERDSFFQNSYEVMKMAARNKVDACISANCISDIYYIIRRSGKSVQEARASLLGLQQLLSICDTTAADIARAFHLEVVDFEDAILAASARRERAQFIITRNIKDYANSPIEAITPEQFLKIS